MYTKRRYSFLMTLSWSRRPFIYGVIYSSIVCGTSYLLNTNFSLPWQPISVIGISVAFYLGFKNNSSYDRVWEARKIWGAIVNNSRTFGAAALSFVQGERANEIQKELIYRHIAWLTALRHQLRLSRPWEHVENRISGVYSPTICENYNTKLEKELSQYISDEEIREVTGKSNAATQLLKKQSIRLQQLMDEGYYEDFRHMEFHKLITNFYTEQGKSERIKNFPFPRQYVSAGIWLTVVFCALIPFGMLNIFASGDLLTKVLCALMGGLLIWVFFLMEMIGDYSENPFEGTYNDVPITSIAVGIEIDLREMLDDEYVPLPVEVDNGFLM